MKNEIKIQPIHLNRNAYVYVRQSTEHQVRENIESQQRQYELVNLARQYQWNEASIVVIDDDLGKSGSSASGRTGFARLVADVALKKAGIIFGLEVSRLARNNKDWYQLLDLCSLTATLIADTDGIYDPSCFNDRLLLGLKGTMSEAELHVLKNRMLQGLYHKAQKGELRFKLPVGYQFNPEGKIIKSFDEQVVQIIDLTFKKFFELGTVYGVLKYFLENHLVFPRRATFEKKIRWGLASYKGIRDTLGNPMYTGAYVFGRTKVIKELDEHGNAKKCLRCQPMEDWNVLIHNHHPAYVSWEDYLKIQQQIEKNASPPKSEVSRVAREGSALLQGLVRCGKCGRAMHVSYHGQGSQSYHYYICNMVNRTFKHSYCQSIGGRRIDQTVVETFLEALSPASLNIHLQALEQIQLKEDLTLKQLSLQLERTQYEADRTFRQFDATEPENRLVARNLEQQWNEALKHVEDLENRIREQRQNFQDQLSKIEEEQIRRLAEDLPTVWNAPTTQEKDKKRLLRAAIEEVQLTKKDRDVTLKVLWNGGATTEKTIHLPKIRSKRASALDLIELLRQLAQKFTDDQIARILIRQGHKTSTGLPFNAQRVATLRYSYRIPSYKKSDKSQPKTYTAQQASQVLGVSFPTVLHWLHSGFIAGQQVTEGAPWEISLTEEQVKRLTAQDAPPGWASLFQATKHLGVSQQTALNWVKSGKLQYIYVSKGKRRGLRINVNSETCQKQLHMFP